MHALFEYVCNPTMDATDHPPITLPEMVSKFFEPDASTTARLKSTTDLYDIIAEHAPGKFRVEDLHDVLIQLGYQARPVGDIIYWSLRLR